MSKLLREATELFRNHQKSDARPKTQERYGYPFKSLEVLLGDMSVQVISAQELYEFLTLLTEGCARSTARLRHAQLKAFFNFMIENFYLSIRNLCNEALLAKTFRAPWMKQREIMGRDVIDEVGYRCRKTSYRLILELQAGCGLRVGEALSLQGEDIKGRALIY